MSKRVGKKKASLPKKQCEFCKDSFVPKRRWAKYCTDSCRWQAWDSANPRTGKDKTTV